MRISLHFIRKREKIKYTIALKHCYYVKFTSSNGDSVRWIRLILSSFSKKQATKDTLNINKNTSLLLNYILIHSSFCSESIKIFTTQKRFQTAMHLYNVLLHSFEIKQNKCINKINGN